LIFLVKELTAKFERLIIENEINEIKEESLDELVSNDSLD